MFKKVVNLFLATVIAMTIFTSLTHAQELSATLLVWSTVKDRMQDLAGSLDNIEKIKRTDQEKPEDPELSKKISKSWVEVYIRYDSWTNTIYYNTEATTIYLNSNSESMFSTFHNLNEIDFSGFDTSNVTNMRAMFNDCNSLTELDLSRFDTRNVTSMQSMFKDCNKLKELDLRSFDTSNVTTFSHMFYWTTNLKTIYVSNLFDVTNATNFNNMFKLAINIVWWKWTTYNSSYYEGQYARVDNAPTNPWYFTDASNITVKFVNIDDDNNETVQYTTWVSKWSTVTGLTSNEIEREAWHYLQYYADSWMTIEFDFSQPITKYTEIYTWWVANQYTITFVDWKWEVVSWANYDYGTPKTDIVLPEAPEREWYEFIEWWWIPDTMPANDITWIAQYNINKYTITFVKWNWEDDYVFSWDYGSGVTPPADPTRAGYTFKWWDKDIPTTIPAENIIITAQWEEIKQSWGWYSWWWGHSHDNSSDNGSAWDEEDTQEQQNLTWDNNISEPGVDNIQNEEPKDNSDKTDTYDPKNDKRYNTYEWAYKNWLTTFDNIEDARLGDSLNRSEMAKISSIFATKFLGKNPDESKVNFCSNFSDLTKLTHYMRNFVVNTCELWYMWYQSNGVDALDKFRPYSPVTVAETSVIVSRMLRWNQNAMDESHWYQGHLYAAYNHGLIDDIRNPFRNITRWEAFDMFYKSLK